MNYSKEIIWHFTCYFCKGWWSIAASEDWQPNASIGFSLAAVKNFYCPHCGRNQEEDQDV